MQSRRSILLSTTVVPLVVLVGVAAGGVALTDGFGVAPAYAHSTAAKCNPCAAAKCNPCAAACNPCAAAKCNPCAAAKCNPCAAACNPCAAAKCNPCAAAKCNPCAAAKCNPCNPCAAACNPCAAAKCNPCAAACNPCNPCAAAACNPCNPCAAGGGASKKCVVPRLHKAAACNPCAVAKCNPCNPCNPCAAAKCNPCNPCAAAKCNPCNPCAAAKCNPCNPCAAAKCNPCNPCAAAKCNPCNPCAAAKCNPCNPCAAGACNPCNPCAAGAGVELTDAEAVKVYDCLMKELKAAYAKSGSSVAASYQSWPRYSRQAFVSGTHGNRYVQNYANAKARAYGAYEKAGIMPPGAIVAKDSFAVMSNGKVTAGPLFIMEKMNAGFNADSGDWRYSMIMPNGSIFGTTNGAGSAKVGFCAGCHITVAPDVDSMMFLPEEYRVNR